MRPTEFSKFIKGFGGDFDTRINPLYSMIARQLFHGPQSEVYEFYLRGDVFLREFEFPFFIPISQVFVRLLIVKHAEQSFQSRYCPNHFLRTDYYSFLICALAQWIEETTHGMDPSSAVLFYSPGWWNCRDTAAK
jgi:hypothetical protein